MIQRFSQNLDHHRLGNFSFFVGFLEALIMALYLIIVGLSNLMPATFFKSIPWAIIPFMLLGDFCIVLWLVALFLTIFGTVIGLVGIFQKNQKKWIATLGMMLNAGLFEILLLIMPRIQPR